MRRLRFGCVFATLLGLAVAPRASAYTGTQQEAALEQSALSTAASQFTVIQMPVLPVRLPQDFGHWGDLLAYASNTGVRAVGKDAFAVLGRLFGPGYPIVHIAEASGRLSDPAEATITWRDAIGRHPLRLGKVVLRPGAGSILIPSPEAHVLAKASLTDSLVHALEQLTHAGALQREESRSPGESAAELPNVSYTSHGNNVLWLVHQLGQATKDPLLKALAPQPMTDGFPDPEPHLTSEEQSTVIRDQRKWAGHVGALINHHQGVWPRAVTLWEARTLRRIIGARQHGWVRPLSVHAWSQRNPGVKYAVHVHGGRSGKDAGKHAYVRQVRVKQH